MIVFLNQPGSPTNFLCLLTGCIDHSVAGDRVRELAVGTRDVCNIARRETGIGRAGYAIDVAAGVCVSFDATHVGFEGFVLIVSGWLLMFGKYAGCALCTSISTRTCLLLRGSVRDGWGCATISTVNGHVEQ